jgi:hypothetical protein
MVSGSSPAGRSGAADRDRYAGQRGSDAAYAKRCRVRFRRIVGSATRGLADRRIESGSETRIARNALRPIPSAKRRCQNAWRAARRFCPPASAASRIADQLAVMVAATSVGHGGRRCQDLIERNVGLAARYAPNPGCISARSGLIATQGTSIARATLVRKTHSEYRGNL